ncbi:MAG TPA: hypothetical protein VII48_14110, partial [Rhizomicrobium sp.]
MVALLLAGGGSLSPAQSAQANQNVLVISGARILPITGPPIAQGVLVIKGGKIVAVGAVGQVQIPSGAKMQEATGSVIMPGIVDSHSHIGIDGNPVVSASQDANESTRPVQPGLRAIDAIDPADPNIRMATAGGITTANIMPGSGNVMGGQTAYVKLRGTTIEQMLIPGTIGGMKM